MEEKLFEDQHNKIDKTKEALYSGMREEKLMMNELKKKEFEVQKNWDTSSSQEKSFGKDTTNLPDTMVHKKSKSVSKIILILSILFFIGALIFAFYVLRKEPNVFSPENIEMSIKGLVSVGAGEDINLGIIIENKNLTNLESAELIIDFPSGARGALVGQEKKSRIVKSLGTIIPGSLVNEKITAEFFGEENEIKTVLVTLEYRFEGSSATLVKETEHTVKIISSPISVSLEIPDEIVSNQEIELVVKIESDTNNLTKNLLLNISYPFGFSFIKADPEPQDDNVWVLPDLEPRGKQVIKILGTIKGDPDSSGVFSADLGIQDRQNSNNIETVFSHAEESVIIKQAFIGLQVLINRQQTEDYIVIKKDEKVYVSILWENNLDTRITDAKITVKLDHDIINRKSILIPDPKGFYMSVDDTIIWNQQTNSELASIPSGGKGVVSFSFNLLPVVSEKGLFKDVELNISASAEGRRLSNVNVLEQIKTPIVGKARLVSDVGLTAKALYRDGPFTNSGPLPPKSNKKTTYTIVWQITNPTNQITNTIIRATLPTYVSWLKSVSPTTENIFYNELGGEIVWSAGEIEAGAGITKKPKIVAFQVELIPSITQVGTFPILVNDATLTATDSFTGSTVDDAEPAQDIRLTADPYYKLIEEKVVQ
ncbi:hypothetical protein KKG37_00330 [Patescibacteria group bacterium]|nr:hypothetical protein [Patescibacteria group bacterium]MBU2009936.1 hypothetical protein [Patescibacteria group bacterium]